MFKTILARLIISVVGIVFAAIFTHGLLALGLILVLAWCAWQDTNALVMFHALRKHTELMLKREREDRLAIPEYIEPEKCSGPYGCRTIADLRGAPTQPLIPGETRK